MDISEINHIKIVDNIAIFFTTVKEVTWLGHELLCYIFRGNFELRC